MKILIKIVSLNILISLVACNSIGMIIAKKRGDFIKPEKETNETIIKYCVDRHVDYDRLYTINSEDHYNAFINQYKDVPCIFIFDKNKCLITTAYKKECPWVMINSLADSSLKMRIIQDTTIFYGILSNFIIIDNKSNKQNADYFILCTWAKFFPKLTSELFETINKQKKEKKINVCHILLNVDLQKNWEPE